MDITPYPRYFWQAEKIRLRGLRPEDAEKKCREWTDSQARSLLKYQLDLPPVSLEIYRARFLDACDFKGALETLSFAIESFDDEILFGLTEHEYRLQMSTNGKVTGYG